MRKLMAGLAALVIACTSCFGVVKPSDEERDICFSLLFRAERIAILDRDGDMIEAFRGDHWCNEYGKLGEDIEILDYYIKSSYKK